MRIAICTHLENTHNSSAVDRASNSSFASSGMRGSCADTRKKTSLWYDKINHKHAFQIKNKEPQGSHIMNGQNI